MSENPPRGKKWSCCSTRTGETKDGRKVYTRLYPIQERRTSMARRLELEDRLLILEIGTKTRRTLHYNRSLGTNHLPSKTPEPMANPWCLSCITLIILLQNRDPWPQFHETTPWPCWRQRRIWNRSDHEPHKMGSRIPVSCQMERIPY